MGRFLAAVILVAILAGCSTAMTMPCDHCSNSRAAMVHTPSSTCCGVRHVACVIDGKEVDCVKAPPECPECARQSARSISSGEGTATK